jgi:hypothetical protein
MNRDVIRVEAAFDMNRLGRLPGIPPSQKRETECSGELAGASVGRGPQCRQFFRNGEEPA